MDTPAVTPASGYVRLQLQAQTGRWLTVGPFTTLTGARHLAEDLIAEPTIRAVRVEHKNRGTWRPAWSFIAGLGLLLVTLAGCHEGAGWTLWEQTDPPRAVKTFATLDQCNRQAARLIYPKAEPGDFGYKALVYHEPICLQSGTVLYGQEASR